MLFPGTYLEDLLLYTTPNVYMEYDDGLIVCYDKDGSIAAYYGIENGPYENDAIDAGIEVSLMFRYIDPDEPVDARVWYAFP